MADFRVDRVLLTGCAPRNLAIVLLACLPLGTFILASTATFQGVPCVNGADFTCNLYRLDPASGNIRQLTFDQEQTWDPVQREDGTVMYSRWEYMVRR